MTLTDCSALRVPGEVIRLTIALAVLSWLAAAQDNPPASCPVTKPPVPAFVPPPHYPSEAGPGGFYLGTPKLWALVWMGNWAGLPLWDTGYRQKIAWWTQGYDWREKTPPLSVTGKRLDAAAPPLVTDGANGSCHKGWGSFIMSGVNFPTTGCWEITGRLNGQELKFVVWVSK